MNNQIKPIRDEIWVLSDNRPGTSSQAIGLAEEMGFYYKNINLIYSPLSKLPNCFLSSSSLRISFESVKQIASQDYLPRFVISAGRRSAPIALFIKKISNNRSKIIQIMNPNIDFKKFDFVILPKHDRASNPSNPSNQRSDNLLITIGSLTRIDPKTIANECEKFSSWFRARFQGPCETESPAKKIALLIGGSSNKTEFTAKSAAKLGRIISTIARGMDAELLVLTSRRTSYEISDAIKLNLKCNFRFFDWAEVKIENPYLAVLGYADFFVTTGDSVSMISECCSTGKPVYIFDERKISSKKHRKFHHDLIDENYAKKFPKRAVELKNFSPKKLDETRRVASIIKNRLE